MNQQEERYGDMIFYCETAYRNDFRKTELKGYPKTAYMEQPMRSKKQPYAPPNYVESMTKWKEGLEVPFTLFIHPHPILGFDPRVAQKPFDPTDLERQWELERQETQKTRPRLVITPAASMDNIDDPKIRQIIMEDIYESTLQAANKLAGEMSFAKNNVKAPLPDSFAPASPLALPKLKPPYVSTEWRMESVSWDGKQVRSGVDATKEFFVRDRSDRV